MARTQPGMDTVQTAEEWQFCGLEYMNFAGEYIVRYSKYQSELTDLKQRMKESSLQRRERCYLPESAGSWFKKYGEPWLRWSSKSTHASKDLEDNSFGENAGRAPWWSCVESARHPSIFRIWQSLNLYGTAMGLCSKWGQSELYNKRRWAGCRVTGKYHLIPLGIFRRMANTVW